VEKPAGIIPKSSAKGTKPNVNQLKKHRLVKQKRKVLVVVVAAVLVAVVVIVMVVDYLVNGYFNRFKFF